MKNLSLRSLEDLAMSSFFKTRFYQIAMLGPGRYFVAVKIVLLILQFNIIEQFLELILWDADILFNPCYSTGPSCSKLTMSLVNDSLKF